MHLTQDQQRLLFLVQEHAGTRTLFEVLCAEFEAALYETANPDDLETTGQLGVAVIHADGEKVDVADASLLIAVAWLRMVADAIMEQDGDVSADIFDDDGVSAFCDSRPLFDVARACGFGSIQVRRAIARVRGGSKSVPWRALRILGTLGEIRVAKRRSSFLRANRIKRLAPCFARSLDAGEIARAKAGSLFYTLTVRDGRYEAGRGRKVRSRRDRRIGTAGLDVLSEADVDVISDFQVPFRYHTEALQPALDYFVSFLAERGYTYQRLVYRAEAA